MASATEKDRQRLLIRIEAAVRNLAASRPGFAIEWLGHETATPWQDGETHDVYFRVKMTREGAEEQASD